MSLVNRGCEPNNLATRFENVQISPSQTESTDPASSARSPISGASEARNLLDPQMVYLYKLADDMNRDMVESIKFLFNGHNPACFRIPKSKSENIKDGRHLITAIQKQGVCYLECLQLLVDALKPQRCLQLVTRIEQEIQRTEALSEQPAPQTGPRHRPSSPHSTLTTLHVLPGNEPLAQKSLTSTHTKRVRLYENADIVIEITHPKEDILLVRMPRAVWQIILANKDTIDSMYQRYIDTRVKELLPISEDTYINVNTYHVDARDVILVHLRCYYPDVEDNLRPSIIGLSVIKKTWAKFIDFLVLADRTLNRC